MILLTTPFDTGDFDANGPYTHAKLESFCNNVLSRDMILVLSYGYLDGNGDYVKGVKAKETYYISDDPGAVPPTTDYTDTIIQAPQTGELICQAAGRVAYQYLVSKGYVSGTILPVSP